jgi:uncharacterized repeat protein (TIGR02543 family)
MPTELQFQQMHSHMEETKKVIPNSLALDRMNTMLAKKGLSKLSINSATLAPIGDEVVVKTASGVSAPAATYSGSILPDAVDNSIAPFFPPIGNQGVLGSCFSWASTYYTMTYMTGFARGWATCQHIMSPKWTYNLTNGGLNNGAGDVYGLIKQSGCATMEDFPYDGSNAEPLNYREWPNNPAVWENALNYRIKRCGYIPFDVISTESISSVKQMLANGYVLVYYTDISAWQYSTVKNNPATTLDDQFVGQEVCTHSDGYYGGHAMTVVGYNENIWTDINKNGIVDNGEIGAFKVANSWGNSWRNQGFCWVAYDALYEKTLVTGGPASPTRDELWGTSVDWIIARTDYQPRAVAQFTLNTSNRESSSSNGLKIGIAVGLPGTVDPAPNTFFPLCINGGAYAFDGSTMASDGVFVMDFSDIIQNDFIDQTSPKRWFLKVYDESTPCLIKSFMIKDLQGGSIQATASGLPISITDSAIVPIDYTLATPVVNCAPMVDAGGVQRITSDNSTVSVNRMKDDGLPVGAPISYLWQVASADGDITIGSPTLPTTTVQVSGLGEYHLDLTADDSQRKGYTTKTIHRTNLQLLGNSRLNLKGGKDIVVNGNYAFVASGSKSIGIYDISNPAGPVLLKAITTTQNIKRIAVAGNYLYVTENYSLETIDISNPANAVIVNAIYINDIFNDIAVYNDYLFITGYSGIGIVSIANRAAPVYLKKISECGIFMTNLCVQGQQLYASMFYDGLNVISIANPENPVLVSSTQLNTNLYDVKVRGNYAYLVGQSLVAIVNISNAVSPVIVGKYSKFANPENVYNEITISGDTAYVQSKDKGVLLLNISDPTNIRPVDYFLPDAPCIMATAFQNGNLYVSGDDASFYVCKPLAVANSSPSVYSQAQANPTVVNGSTTVLSTLGADDGGETNLTYTWVTTGTPPAPVTFSINGTNSAKNTTVTFTASGTYTFQVTIKDIGNLTATSSASVNVTVYSGLTQQAVSLATASSSENASTQPSAATDGSTTTRWSSSFSDPQWIMFDMGTPKIITTVVFDWEAANAKNYVLEGSNDVSFATKYTLKTLTNMGTQNHRIDSLYDFSNPGLYRYYRMYGTSRNTVYGYSIWEARVYTGGSTPATYSLTTTASPTAGGTISGNGSASYNAGTTVSLTAIPASGYIFTSWSGAVTGTTNPITVTMDGNKILTANFTLIATYSVTASAGANGTITPVGTLTANVGTTSTFTITPNTNYTVDQVLVDGVNVGSVVTYTFSNNTTGSHTINVTFKINNNYITIPGTFQTEDYKTGGSNVGYYDMTSGNTGGAYKPNDNVDIEATTDVSGAYNVGWTDANEWLSYDINVIQSGTYKMSARIASGLSGTKTLTMTLDGNSLTTISTTTSAGWQAWTDAVSANFNLTAGNHVLRVTLSGGVNLNYFNISSVVTNPGVLQFSLASYSVNENGGSATVTVNRSSGSDGSVSLNYATSNGTATAGSDYTASTGTLTFAAGVTSQTFTVAITDDQTVESSETINLTLSSPIGATLGSPTSAVLTIADNDVSTPGALQFSASSYSVNENGTSATVTVSRVNGSSGSVTVNYATSNGTATAGSDYTAATGILTFAAGVISQTFTIAIADDQSVESSETINLTLSSPTGGATLGSPTSAVLTIADNDQAGIQIPGTFQAEDYKAGGSNVGYYDLTAGNTGGVYKPNDAVDIEVTSDPIGGGYNVGWTDNTEWLAYDVNVQSSGTYKMTARLASGLIGTKTLTVTIDGNALTTVSTSNSSGWQSWFDAVSANFNLTAGSHVIRVTMSGGLNINYFNISASTATNLITNGDFSNGGTGWTNGGTTFGTVSFASQTADWTITNGGGQAYEPQMIQGVSLVAGRQYTLCFDIRTDEAVRSMVVSVNGDADNSWADRGLNQTVSVTTSWITQSFTFTANATDVTARLDFNMGGNANDVTIDNVRLIEGTSCN